VISVCLTNADNFTKPIDDVIGVFDKNELNTGNVIVDFQAI